MELPPSTPEGALTAEDTIKYADDLLKEMFPDPEYLEKAIKPRLSLLMQTLMETGAGNNRPTRDAMEYLVRMFDYQNKLYLERSGGARVGSA